MIYINVDKDFVIQNPYWLDSMLGILDCNSGKIVVEGLGKFLFSEEMHDFRKRIVEEDLLEKYIFRRLVLSPVKRNNSSKFHIIDGDNIDFLKNHYILSKEDMRALHYDFEQAKKFIPGKGNALLWSKLFSKKESGITLTEFSDSKVRVFQKKNECTDITNIICKPQALDVCSLSGKYEVITEPKIILSIGERGKFTFVEADSDNPVCIGHNNFVILGINKDVILPEYFHILEVRGIFDKIVEEYGKDSLLCWDYKPAYYEDGKCIEKEVYITPEKTIRSLNKIIQLPSLDRQRQEIEDFKFIYASTSARERALNSLLEEKTWLNEKHIRNIKHQIANELMPVNTDVTEFCEMFERHNGVLSLETRHGKDEVVKDMLERMQRCVVSVSETLNKLTKRIEASERISMDIVEYVRKYVDENANGANYKITATLPEKSIVVIGSPDLFRLMLDNIVWNANRHGFIDRGRTDYIINVSVSESPDGHCNLEVQNNGIPMSDLAKAIYFERGSVASETGNSGEGGADIRECAERMGGSVSLHKCDICKEWPVCISISLPII